MFPERSDETPLLAFVGVQSDPMARDRRDLLRSTWFVKSAASAELRFVVGRTDPATDRDVDEEAMIHGDMLVLDGLQDRGGNPGGTEGARKTLAHLQAALREFDAAFYVKTSDEIWLGVERLLATLQERRSEDAEHYVGCMKSGPVLRNRWSRWYEPEAWRLAPQYFQHAAGQVYVLSRGLVEFMVDHADALHLFANEDVSVGAWVLGLQVTYADDRRFCCETCPSGASPADRCVASWAWRCGGVCEAEQRLPSVHAACSSS